LLCGWLARADSRSDGLWIATSLRTTLCASLLRHCHVAVRLAGKGGQPQ
jgi:hypothetical protein